MSLCWMKRDGFYLVTGPNHGGKSIFAYSVRNGAGIVPAWTFVPHTQAKMSPVNRHFYTFSGFR